MVLIEIGLNDWTIVKQLAEMNEYLRLLCCTINFRTSILHVIKIINPKKISLAILMEKISFHIFIAKQWKGNYNLDKSNLSAWRHG